MGKLGTNTIVDSGNAPRSVVIDITEFTNYGIQLNYGAGTGTTAKLQASLDASDINSGTWVDIADSSQTLANGGGSFVWNVTNAFYPKLKVVVTGDAVSCVTHFAGDPEPRRG